MKKWLIDRFLPIWAKETILRDNARLEKENEMLYQQICQLEARIQGLEFAIRAGKRITVYSRGGDV